MTRPVLAAGLLLLATLSAAAQDLPFQLPGEEKKQHLDIKVTVSPADPFSDANQARPATAKKTEVRRGDTFFVTFHVTPQDGWYTYPMTRRGSEQSKGQIAKLSVEAGDHLTPLYPVRETEPVWIRPSPVVEWELQHKKPFVWSQEVFVKPTAAEGKPLTLKYVLDLQVCKKSCVLEQHPLEVEVMVSTEAPLAPPADISKRPTKAPELVLVTHPEDAKKPGAKKPDAKRADSSRPAVTAPPGLLGALGRAILSGLLSLLTPCVFPMIPITVSYFIKQGEAKKGSPVMMALVYSGTITLVLVAGGLALMQVLTAVINHPITNFVLGGLFLFFALSLFGMYDITLPSWLQDATSSGEGKGGLAGVFFMALTFSIISFACVGPIYGGFLTVEAAGSTGQVQRVLAVIAFSAAFASPFFLLALFPTMLRSMPRAGSWMNAVKVVMGFLELAAFVKFVRSGELLWFGSGQFMSYSLCMASYVAICVACGLYLLGLYRLPHDHEAPETVSVPRLLFAGMFLSLGLYLVPGIFPVEDEDVPRKGLVYGWVDGFLLPEPSKGPARSAAGGKESLVWLSNLEEALSRARAEKKLVFLDFTGINCTNCKVNERRIFPRPEVQKAFSKHVLLKLYTDTVPSGVSQLPSAAEAVKFRTEKFESESLPLYVLLRPTADSFEVVDKYGMLKGLIEDADVPAFLEFLGH